MRSLPVLLALTLGGCLGAAGPMPPAADVEPSGAWTRVHVLVENVHGDLSRDLTIRLAEGGTGRLHASLGVRLEPRTPRYEAAAVWVPTGGLLNVTFEDGGEPYTHAIQFLDAEAYVLYGVTSLGLRNVGGWDCLDAPPECRPAEARP